jgi:hypothetical protein
MLDRDHCRVEVACWRGEVGKPIDQLELEQHGCPGAHCDTRVASFDAANRLARGAGARGEFR